MSKIKDNLEHIQQHRNEETTGRNSSFSPVLNLSVGRARVVIDGEEIVLWAVQPNAYIDWRLREAGVYYKNKIFIGSLKEIISKNHPLWQIIQNSYKGEYQVRYKGEEHIVKIIDSAKYTMATYNTYGRKEITIGVEGESESLRSSNKAGWWYVETNEAFSKFIDILIEEEKYKAELASAEKEIALTDDNLNSYANHPESLLAKEEQEKKQELERKRAALQEAHSKRLMQMERSHLIYKDATLSIKENLAKDQNEAKFANLYQNQREAVIINGGPGTGKTTTMIQRLKLLLSDLDIKDNLEPDAYAKISKTQKDLMEKANWIFFSPSDMLRRYLLNDMRHEGLANPESNSNVWSDFLNEQLLEKYSLLKNFKAPIIQDETNPYINPIGIVESFIKFFINESLIAISKESEDYKYSELNPPSPENVRTISDLCKLCLNIKKQVQLDLSQIENSLETYRNTLVASLIEKAFQTENIALLYQIAVETRNIEEIRDNLIRPFIERVYDSFAKSNFTAEEISSGPSEEQKIKQIISDFIKAGELDILKVNQNESLREVTIKKIEGKLLLANNILNQNRFIQTYSYLHRNILQTKDTRNKIEKNLNLKFSRQILHYIKELSFLESNSEDKQIAILLKRLITPDEMEKLMESYAFKETNQNFLNNYFEYLITKSSEYYNRFRQGVEEGNEMWNQSFIRSIRGNNFREIYQQEQSLIFGFVNKSCAAYYNVAKDDFTNSDSKIVRAYKNNTYMVIGIDEATDYSIMDYFAIMSMQRYENDVITSFTLSGDIAQRLGNYSIKDWSEIKCRGLFADVDLHELKTSYRQSSILNKLAGDLYTYVENKEYPYKEVSGNIEEVYPIQIKKPDKQERIDWLCERILEMKEMADGDLYSTAIFTKDVESAAELYRNLTDRSGKLYQNHIRDNRIQCWPNFDETRPQSIRILPISAVKGTEFPAVFLFDIDEMGDSELIKRYLFIGVTRANSYFGITSSGKENSISKLLDKYLTHNVWERLK